MPAEDTPLERRTLAHEQILQALMAQLAEGQPDFLTRMHERFASARRGAHEYDYVETADYAEAFLHEVERLVRVRTAVAPHALAAMPPPRPSAGPTDAVTIHSARLHGVWHVTRNGAFVGDYIAEGPALEAAAAVARDVERGGGRAEILLGPGL